MFSCPDPKSILLSIDAYMCGLGVILCVCKDGVDLPVSYNRLLTDRKKHYSASKLECLVDYETVRHFELYLHERELTCWTDHKALTSFIVYTSQLSLVAMGIVIAGFLYILCIQT